MLFVALLEGMQIAFFAVATILESERSDSVFAKKTCELFFGGLPNFYSPIYIPIYLPT
jgi:hypothetical protein